MCVNNIISDRFSGVLTERNSLLLVSVWYILKQLFTSVLVKVLEFFTEL